MLVDGGMMNNVPADVVKAHGRRPRRRRQRRRPVRSRGRQLLDVRAGRRHARRDDAREHQGVRLQPADIIIDVPLARLRIARLAAQRRADRRGLSGRRGDARSPAAARRRRGGVRGVAAAPVRRAAGPTLPAPAFVAARGLRRRTSEAPERAARAPRRRAARYVARSRRTSRSSPASIATRPSPGASCKNAAGGNGLLVGRARSPMRRRS